MSNEIKMYDQCSRKENEMANHQPNVERNNARVARYPDDYRLRLQIVEPIFCVWKRQWHFDHLMLRTKTKVGTEVSIAVFTCNLMRLVKVKGLVWIKKESKKLYILLETIMFLCRPLYGSTGIIRNRRKSPASA